MYYVYYFIVSFLFWLKGRTDTFLHIFTDITIFSYNVNGIRSKFNTLMSRYIYPPHMSSPDIICFQELKCDIPIYDAITHSLKHYCCYGSISPGCAATKEYASKGVLVAIKKSSNIEILDFKRKDGVFVLVKCKYLDNVFVVGSIYLESWNCSDAKATIDDIDFQLAHLQCDNVILTGDFNFSFSELDNSIHLHRYHKKSSSYFEQKVMEKWELQDVWRIQHPFTRKFSHCAVGPLNSARLDYCFVSVDFSCFIKECEFGVSYCSDHLPMFTKLHFNSPPKRKHFCFPIDLCHSEQFLIQFRSNLRKLKQENDNARPDIFWELIKPCARGSALGFKKLRTIYRKEMIESLEAKLSLLYDQKSKEKNSLARASIWESMNEVKKEIDEIYTQYSEKKYAHNLARWYSQSGCTSKYFLSKFKKDRTRPVISQLMTESGLVESNDEILCEAGKFYSKLFQKEKICLPTENLDEVPILSEENVRLMDEPISIEELYNSLKCMKKASAPGSDGLTVSFYLTFWEDIKEYLFASYMYAFENGHLSLSQRLGLVRLLPKKFRNLLWICHWRPITLLNVDFKILTKLFALRLQKILPDIIHPDQRGFIHGRRIDHGILDIYAILDIVDDEKMDSLLCTLDIAKAFDSLDWNFVKYALQLFGFPESFLRWFDVLCTEKEIRITNNGDWSDPIKVNKGSAQGCPLSPLLFVISIEILAVRIRNNTEIKGIPSQNMVKKLNLVADDILLAFQNSFSACSQVLDELKIFSQESGLKVNLDKCTVSRIGPMKNIPLEQDVFPQFKRANNEFHYIGFDFTFDPNKLWDRNVSPKFEHIFKEVCKTKDFTRVSLLGRVILLKSLFYSKVVYFTNVLPLPPPRKISLYQQQLNEIVWHGKQPKIKFSCAVAHPQQGGIGLINVDLRLKTQRLLILQAALNTIDIQFWQDHLYSLFRIPFDRLILSNLSFNHMKRFLCDNKSLHPFWQDILQIWCAFHYKNFKASVESESDIMEIVSRPAVYNSAVLSYLTLDKRLSSKMEDFYIDQGWFTLADFIQSDLRSLPKKGLVTQLNAIKMQKSIPKSWKTPIEEDPYFCNLAQSFVDQKWNSQKLYSSMLKPDFSSRLVSWSKEGLTISKEGFDRLALKCTLIKNINLRSFFIKFNYKGITLNQVVAKFALISDKCTFCTNHEENYVHLFWNCQYVTPLWNHIKSKLWGEYQEYVTLNKVFFPIDVPHGLFLLFTIVKNYIYRCRCVKSKVSISHMRNDLKFHIRVLYFAAVFNEKEQSFLRTWKILLDALKIELPDLE